MILDWATVAPAMKTRTKNEMNPINPALQRSYSLTLRGLLMAIVALVALICLSVMSSSCAGGGFKVPAVLPFDVGIKYEIEKGLFVVATPAEGGGLDVKFEGTAAIGDHVVYDGTSWTITSPNTGIIYKITPGLNGRPKIEIVGGGNGKLQLVPTTPPPTAPVLTEPVPEPPPPVANPA